MPELPEVETVRRDLAPLLTGRTVRAVTVTRDRAVRRQSQTDFAAALTGRHLTGVRRHGKFLIVDLDGEEALVAHLRMSGQLRINERGDALLPHTHVVLDFDDDTQLRFIDPRTFGEMFVDAVGDGRRPAALETLGPDALNDRLAPDVFHARLRRGRTTATVKAALLDQRTIAGVGNLYADEVLYAVGMHPRRPASALKAPETAALQRALQRILRAAIRARGSSFKDDGYLDAYGNPGRFAARHRVYGRTGEACGRCGGVIERLVVAQRGTHICGHCQRL